MIISTREGRNNVIYITLSLTLGIIASTLERGARLVLDDLEDLLELLHLVVLGKDLGRIMRRVYLGAGLGLELFRVGVMAGRELGSGEG